MIGGKAPYFVNFALESVWNWARTTKQVIDAVRAIVTLHLNLAYNDVNISKEKKILRKRKKYDRKTKKKQTTLIWNKRVEEHILPVKNRVNEKLKNHLKACCFCKQNEVSEADFKKFCMALGRKLNASCMMFWVYNVRIAIYPANNMRGYINNWVYHFIPRRLPILRLIARKTVVCGTQKEDT